MGKNISNPKIIMAMASKIECKCNECGRKWDGSLFQLNIKQDEYGKIIYECIDLREKPVNSVDYESTVFDDIGECYEWIRVKNKEIKEALKP